MGSHRAEPGSSHGPSETPADPTYVGRRAARPATPEAQASVEEPQLTPYVARRLAAPRLDDTAERGLDAPVQPHRVPTASARTDTFYFGDLDVTAELPLVRAAAPAGRRRATRHEGARGPLFRGLPSVPILVGVATLAIAIGGAIASTGPALADHHTAQVRQAGALSGSSGVASVAGSRGPSVSRSSSRQTLAQASGDEVAAATEELAQHNTALDDLAQKAEHQAARLNNNRWILPVEGYHLTARFGDTGLWESFHTGLDFACPTGTPIHAISSGVVTFASYDGAYGNKTVITMPDGTEIWYGHQTTQVVHVGDTVTRGELIGTVGSTGHVTGPHVHIEVRPGGGDPVDPYPAFVVHGVTP